MKKTKLPISGINSLKKRISSWALQKRVGVERQEADPHFAFPKSRRIISKGTERRQTCKLGAGKKIADTHDCPDVSL